MLQLREGILRMGPVMNIRRFTLWLSAFLLLFCVCIIGDLVSLGERVSSASTVLGIVYYVIVGAVFIACVFVPVIRVVLTPEIKGDIIIDAGKKNELKHTAKESAKLSLILTTVSQNGSVDMLANVAVSFRLIGSLVRQAGYRPTFPQLLRLYLSVLSTSWIVASADELLDNLDIGAIVNNAGVGAVCKLFQPLANGAANAYTCLRIGYATIKYLEVGSCRYLSGKKEIRRQVAREARADLVPVIKSEAIDIVKKFR